jgi:hypothetical protein
MSQSRRFLGAADPLADLESIGLVGDKLGRLDHKTLD